MIKTCVLTIGDFVDTLKGRQMPPFLMLSLVLLVVLAVVLVALTVLTIVLLITVLVIVLVLILILIHCHFLLSDFWVPRE